MDLFVGRANRVGEIGLRLIEFPLDVRLVVADQVRQVRNVVVHVRTELNISSLEGVDLFGKISLRSSDLALEGVLESHISLLEQGDLVLDVCNFTGDQRVDAFIQLVNVAFSRATNRQQCSSQEQSGKLFERFEHKVNKKIWLNLFLPIYIIMRANLNTGPVQSGPLPIRHKTYYTANLQIIFLKTQTIYTQKGFLPRRKASGARPGADGIRKEKDKAKPEQAGWPAPQGGFGSGRVGAGWSGLGVTDSFRIRAKRTKQTIGSAFFSSGHFRFQGVKIGTLPEKNKFSGKKRHDADFRTILQPISATRMLISGLMRLKKQYGR